MDKEALSNIADQILNEWANHRAKVEWGDGGMFKDPLFLYVKLPNKWFRLKVEVRQTYLSPGSRELNYFVIPKWNLEIVSVHAKSIWDSELKIRNDKKLNERREDERNRLRKALKAFGLWQNK